MILTKYVHGLGFVKSVDMGCSKATRNYNKRLKNKT